MKYFLLMAGNHGESPIGTTTWIKTFATLEEATADIVPIQSYNFYGDVYYALKSREHTQYSWVKIVDLRKWIE